MRLGLLGLCTKRELKREVNKEKVKSYKNGYEDALETINSLNEQLAKKDDCLFKLIKENRELKSKIREERHEEIRRIRSIARNTKKLRVKKKCEARLNQIYLSK